MKIRSLCLLPVVLLTAACASTGSVSNAPATTPDYQYTANPRFDAISRADNKHDRDRLAILAMQGEYRVGFHFQETVALKSGYDTRDAKNSGGYEIVLVVEDTAEKIVLQHLLVMPGGAVIKHWRQDWAFQAVDQFNFVADQTWEVQAIETDRREGAWTQCVFEVSDAPRYCGTGQWNHRYGVSTWTSGRSWRPLPRREYTTRKDYNALNAENRHTITANGWTHEQDNTKTVRDGRRTQETLVREFGFNNYRNITGYDFEPAREYWSTTSEYWAAVRDAWARRLVSGNAVVLNMEVDGMPLIVATFEQAENAAATTADEERQAIEALFSEYTESRRSPSLSGGASLIGANTQ